jgi:hypothetical protein
MAQLNRNIRRRSVQGKKYHPDGMASLIAVILAPTAPDVSKEQFQAEVDRVHDQVLYMAHQFYKINPCDFDNSANRRSGTEVNNLARLDRANLR